MAIRRNHPVRGDVATLSSGPRYYDTTTEYWGELLTILGRHDFTPQSVLEVHTDEGRTTIPLYEGGIETGHVLVITWYRMPSQRWEIVNYVSI